MSILEKLRKAVAPAELFNDKVRVYTTEYGTQYIDPEVIFLDQQALDEVRRFGELVRAVQLQELEAQAENDSTTAG